MKTRVDSQGQRRQNMNWDEADNNLDDFRERVQQRWQHLADEQIEQIAGRREKLSSELQRTYRLTEEEAEDEIQQFETGIPGATAAASGRGPTERTREFGTGNDQGGGPRSDKHRLH